MEPKYYEKYLDQMISKKLKNITFDPDPQDFTNENSDILLDIVKKQYGISDKQMTEMKPEEMKKLIRNKKLGDII
jgi:hypothetical protein